MKLSPSKTVTSVFHLHNNRSRRELNVCMNGQRLQPNPYPVYLGVTSDQTLSYREHLSHSTAKLKSKNNLITKLAGTSWGASASTLCTSALALCYSVAGYCCPVWARSSYTNLIDTQLHSAVHLISGCLQPTQLSWLPVLSSVASSLRLCMLMSLSIHLHGLHLDVQYGQTGHLSTQLHSEERTCCQLLWSTTLLLPTYYLTLWQDRCRRIFEFKVKSSILVLWIWRKLLIGCQEK